MVPPGATAPAPRTDFALILGSQSTDSWRLAPRGTATLEGAARRALPRLLLLGAPQGLACSVAPRAAGFLSSGRPPAQDCEQWARQRLIGDSKEEVTETEAEPSQGGATSC